MKRHIVCITNLSSIDGLEGSSMNKRSTLEETAAHFRVSTKTLAKYVQLYKIPHVRFGRNTSFNIQKVEDFLETQNITLKSESIKIGQSVGFRNEKSPSRFDEALGLG